MTTTQITEHWVHTSTQGTAMAETALCWDHYHEPLPMEMAGDWDGKPHRLVRGNEALSCLVCGA